jgi:hypothetical protein
MRRFLTRLAPIGLAYSALSAAAYLAYTSHFAAVADFYVFWVATRVALAGGNPYSQATAELIQATLFGQLQPPAMDQVAFVSPFYHIFLTAPLALLPYSIASSLWLGLMFTSLVGGLALAMRSFAWMPKPLELAALVVASMFTFPAFASAMLGQTTALVFGLVTLVIWAELARRPAIAGSALAIATVKPQLIALILPAMLIWWLARRQWRALAAFAATLTTLIGASLLAFPAWPWEFLAALTRYPTYKDVRLGPEYLIDVSHPLGQALVAGSIGALVVWLLWAWRDAIKSPDDRFTAAAALTLVMTCVILPQTNIVNWLVCLPAILLVLRDLPRSKPWQRALWLLACLAVLVLPWAAYAAFWPNRYDLLISLPPMAVLLAMVVWYKCLRPHHHLVFPATPGPDELA